MTKIDILTEEIKNAEYILRESFSSESWLRSLYNELLEKRAKLIKERDNDRSNLDS